MIILKLNHLKFLLEKILIDFLRFDERFKETDQIYI